MNLGIDESVFGEYEIVNEIEMGDFRKIRAVFENATADFSSVKTDEPQEFIKDRKEELNEVSVDVPHPYKAQIDSKDSGSESVKFDSQDGTEFGLGYANTEYNLVLDEGESPRYRYFIAWKLLENSVVEMEAYVPVDDFSMDEAIKLFESVELD